MKLIICFFDYLSKYRILKTKCDIQLQEIRKELGFKPIDSYGFLFALYAGIIMGSAITWIGYFIFN